MLENYTQLITTQKKFYIIQNNVMLRNETAIYLGFKFLINFFNY